MKAHNNFVTHTSIKNFHHDAIRKLKYIQASNVIISASIDPKASIVIFDLDHVRNPYFFQMNKVCIRISIITFVYFSSNFLQMIKLVSQ